jgi:uncharacterized protein (TIGR02300 family)
VAKPEWGTKRTCYSCGARFYDLRRDPIVCPICATAYDPDRQPKVRRGGAAVRDEPVLEPVLAGRGRMAASAEDELVTEDAGDGEVEDIDDAVDEDSAGDLDELNSDDRELIEDTSELGEDDDDIGEVMEHVDEELEDKA